MSEITVTEYVPDMIDGYDDAMLGCHYVPSEEEEGVLLPIVIYSGPLLAQIAVESEGISWEDALEWASNVAYTGEFAIIVMWEYVELEFELEPNKPHLTIVH
jgi:hypothetical protein